MRPLAGKSGCSVAELCCPNQGEETRRERPPTGERHVGNVLSRAPAHGLSAESGLECWTRNFVGP